MLERFRPKVVSERHGHSTVARTLGVYSHASPARYPPDMVQTRLRRLHNPRNRECFCDPDCWCRRTALGRAVKWWFPARYFGIRHKSRALEAWKQDQPEGALEDWKRRQHED